jgi:hypothetical protein
VAQAISLTRVQAGQRKDEEGKKKGEKSNSVITWLPLLMVHLQLAME